MRESGCLGGLQTWWRKTMGLKNVDQKFWVHPMQGTKPPNPKIFHPKTLHTPANCWVLFLSFFWHSAEPPKLFTKNYHFFQNYLTLQKQNLNYAKFKEKKCLKKLSCLQNLTTNVTEIVILKQIKKWENFDALAVVRRKFNEAGACRVVCSD